jgi:hypothetical protein
MAVMEGAKRRMTPVALTACIAAFGLVPFLFAEGPGSEIQRPLAVVVIGGLISATVLTLVVLPILYDRFAVPGAKAAAVAGGAGPPRSQAGGVKRAAVSHFGARPGPRGGARVARPRAPPGVGADHRLRRRLHGVQRVAECRRPPDLGELRPDAGRAGHRHRPLAAAARGGRPLLALHFARRAARAR